MNEQEILQQIAEAEVSFANAQEKMRQAKQTWVEAESIAIEYKVRLDNLKEQLRQLRLSTPTYVPNAREQEIAEFRTRMPELIKKV